MDTWKTNMQGLCSEQPGFLLHVVALPERKSVELLHLHPKDLNEELRSQVALQSGPVDVPGELHTPSVGDSEHVVWVHFWIQHIRH